MNLSCVCLENTARSYVSVGKLDLSFFQKLILQLFSIFLHKSDVWSIHVWLRKQAGIMRTRSLTACGFQQIFQMTDEQQHRFEGISGSQ